MALTMRRWLAVAILSCALIGVGMMRGRSRPDRHAIGFIFDPFAWRLRPSTSQELARTADRLRALEIRDSLVAIDGPSSRTPGLTVRIDAAMADSTARALDSMARRQWRSLGIDARIPVVLAFVLDTVQHVRGVRRVRPSTMPIDIFLPRATDGRACLAIARLPNIDRSDYAKWQRMMRSGVLSGDAADALFGPCAFLAEFGDPGPSVARWLRGDNWDVARYVDWARSAPAWARDSRDFSNPVARLVSIGGQWTVRGWLSPDGVACMAGRVSRCEQALMAPPTSADSGWGENIVSSSGFDLNRGIWFMHPPQTGLGPARVSVLSDAVVDLGRERFRQFWSSPLEVDAAFRAASGRSLADWTARWAQSRYGRERLGPTVTTRGIVAGVFFAAAGIFLALFIAQRRRFVS